MTSNFPIRILYDHQIFEMQQYGGISRYFYELINGLTNFKDFEPSLSLIVNNNKYIVNIDSQYILPGKPQNPFSKKSMPLDNELSILYKFKDYINNKRKDHKAALYNKINISNSIEVVKKGDFDIFHPTYFDPYFLPYLNKKPFILTIYDLISERYPEFYLLDDTTMNNRKILINKASHIIAISQSTKNDIMKYYNIPEEKISVIYLGSEILSKNTNLMPDEIPTKYLLYVGARNLYKNFHFFIEVLTPLLLADDELKIICFGGESVSTQEKRFIHHLGLDEKILFYRGSDDLLSHFYMNAFALIHPSLYEGFGIPIIEAFKYSCPVIASRIPSTIEIGKNAVLYFDPKDPVSIRESVNKLLEDEKLRNNLIKEGKKENQKYHWNKTCQETYQMYIDLINESN